MSSKTTIRFIGELAAEFPAMAIRTKEMIEGDVLQWINEGFKAADAIGKVVGACMGKKNNKLLADELELFDENEQTDIDELKNKVYERLSVKINELKQDFQNNKAKLLEQQKTKIAFTIEENNALSDSMAKMRASIKELIDMYDKELSGSLNSDAFSDSFRRTCEENIRILHNIYKNHIDI